MLQYTEEILDCVDLVENNNYYIQFPFTIPDNEYAIQFTEKYNGMYKMYKITKEMKPTILNYNKNLYELTNESNVTLYLTNYSMHINTNIFVCDIHDDKKINCCVCKIYKVNDTEYILK
jgi:hypothetical protein